MSLPPQADAILRAGVAALQRGAGADAARLFGEFAAAFPTLSPPWFLMAQAARMTSDPAAEERALDALLGHEPRHLRALLMKGDARARAGDDRGASSFFQMALQVASADRAAAQPLGAELARAQSFLAGAQARYEEHLRAALAAGGADPEAIGGRFRQSIDILCGRTQPYLQSPTSFYYPGLPQIQFYDAHDFAWAAALEAETGAIRAELEAALAAGGAGFAPYIQPVAGRPQSTNALYNDPRWSGLYLWRNGAREVADRFPLTHAALDTAPLPHIAGRSPMALFSALQPGTHIRPHNGMLNTRLICHLPLIVPGGCTLRVGNETRAWAEGRLTIFDDSIEHEARNGSDRLRVVLLFEIWRPELSDEERAALTVLYESIALYDGSAN